MGSSRVLLEISISTVNISEFFKKMVSVCHLCNKVREVPCSWYAWAARADYSPPARSYLSRKAGHSSRETRCIWRRCTTYAMHWYNKNISFLFIFFEFLLLGSGFLWPKNRKICMHLWPKKCLNMTKKYKKYDLKI